MQLRHKGGIIPKINRAFFFVCLTPPTLQSKTRREVQKLSKFQRAKVLTKSGPGKHCSEHRRIFL